MAALLVHLAAVDGSTSDAERDAVRHSLMDYYDLNEDEVEKLVDEATRRDSEAVDFYRFTSAITQLTEEERIEIIRMTNGARLNRREALKILQVGGDA